MSQPLHGVLVAETDSPLYGKGKRISFLMDLMKLAVLPLNFFPLFSACTPLFTGISLVPFIQARLGLRSDCRVTAVCRDAARDAGHIEGLRRFIVPWKPGEVTARKATLFTAPPPLPAMVTMAGTQS